MCSYQGYEFGATYLDSVCIDGRLFDADQCDDVGNLFEPLDYIPCPACCAAEAVKYYIELWDDGDAENVEEKATHLVNDIRKNRGLAPWPPPKTKPAPETKEGERRPSEK